MSKEIKGLYIIYGMWIVIGILGMIFTILFGLPRALQYKDSVGLVFSAIFGVLFLIMIIGFGYLLKNEPKKIRKKYQEIYQNYPELENNLDLIQERSLAIDQFNYLYFYRDTIFYMQYRKFLIPIYLNEIDAIGVRVKWTQNGKVRSKNLFLLSKSNEKETATDLGIVSPEKYDYLTRFLQAVQESKPNLLFYNEVEN